LAIPTQQGFHLILRGGDQLCRVCCLSVAGHSEPLCAAGDLRAPDRRSRPRGGQRRFCPEARARPRGRLGEAVTGAPEDGGHQPAGQPQPRARPPKGSVVWGQPLLTDGQSVHHDARCGGERVMWNSRRKSNTSGGATGAAWVRGKERVPWKDGAGGGRAPSGSPDEGANMSGGHIWQ